MALQGVGRRMGYGDDSARTSEGIELPLLLRGRPGGMQIRAIERRDIVHRGHERSSGGRRDEVEGMDNVDVADELLRTRRQPT